jgi:hypothetical protein
LSWKFILLRQVSLYIFCYELVTILYLYNWGCLWEIETQVVVFADCQMIYSYLLSIFIKMHLMIMMLFWNILYLLLSGMWFSNSVCHCSLIFDKVCALFCDNVLCFWGVRRYL